MRVTISIFAFACMLGAVAMTAAEGATFYADPVNGSMAGDGSAANPWGRLQDVFSAGLVRSRDLAGNIKNASGPVGPGDTILLRSGLHGDVNLYQYFNDSPVTVAAEAGQTPILKRWAVTGGSGWRLRGVTVSPEPYGVLPKNTLIAFSSHGFHGPMSDVVVEDCTAYTVQNSDPWTADDWLAYAGSGIAVSGDGPVIRGNTVKNVGFGINAGGNDVLIENNVVENFAGDGVRCGGDRVTIQYNTIMNSYKVDGNHDDAIQFFAGYGVGSASGVIRGNRISGGADPTRPLRHGPQGLGCFDGPYTDWIVENNVITVDHWHGIALYGAQNCRVMNNTCLNITGTMTCWIELAGGNWDNIVRNNITREIHPGEVSNILDHNLLLGQISPDDVFVDWPAGDLRLKAGGPAVDAGSLDGAPATDIDGVARPAGMGVDIGAFETPAATAAAGADQAVDDADADGAEWIHLDGTASTSPDGAIALYVWSEDGASLGTGPTLDVSLPIGVHTITLLVYDETGSTGSDTVVVEVRRVVVADAGGDQRLIDADEDGVEVVFLDGSGSAVFGGSIVAHVWYEGDTLLTTGAVGVTILPLGEHTITLEVTDDEGVKARDTALVTVVAPSAAAPGDANGDGHVNIDDFVILKNNFGASGASWAQGDFNGDGEVDIDDFVILKNNFGL